MAAGAGGATPGRDVDYAILGTAAVALVSLPALVDRWAVRRGASPGALALLAIVTLAGLVALPFAFTACVGALGGDHAVPLASRLGLAMLVMVLALMVGRALGTLVRIRRARSELSSAIDALGPRERVDGVAVLPVGDVLAFCSGTDAFVSRGLVEGLSPAQRRAVVEHEREHAQGGHARLTAAARAASRALFGAAPARRAEHALSRELDVLADRAAAHRLGSPGPVREALRRIGAGGSAGDGEPDADAEERIERLGPRPAGRGADGVVGLVALLLLALVVAAICVSTHAGAQWLGVAACMLAVLGLASAAMPLLRGSRRAGVRSPINI